MPYTSSVHSACLTQGLLAPCPRRHEHRILTHLHSRLTQPPSRGATPFATTTAVDHVHVGGSVDR